VMHRPAHPRLPSAPTPSRRLGGIPAAVGAGAEGARVVVSEGMVKLNGSAGEILTRCNGARPLLRLSVTSRVRSPLRVGEGRAAFMAMALDKQWLEIRG